MIRSDVLILGAGPAGGVAAVVLARAGAEVTLIERANLPREKLCSGVISPRSYAALSALGLLDVYTSAQIGGVHRTEMRLLGGSATHEHETPIRLVSRPAFDAGLASRAARHGARIIDGTKAMSLDAETGAVTTADGETYTANVVIGADGARGISSRALNGTLPRHGIAMEFRLPTDERYRLDTERIDWTLPNGYLWAFPKYDGRVAIGGGTFVEDRFQGLRAKVASYSRSLGIEPPEQISGHPLPAFPVSSMARGRVLLAGDAAGLVDPLLGEGIAYALWSGILAARTALAHLDGEAAALASYPSLIASRILSFQRPLRRTYAMRSIIERLGLTRLARSDSATRMAWRYLIERVPSEF